MALAAVARNFLSRYFDALGAGPDPELIAKEPELWDYLKDWDKHFDQQGTPVARESPRLGSTDFRSFHIKIFLPSALRNGPAGGERRICRSSHRFELPSRNLSTRPAGFRAKIEARIGRPSSGSFAKTSSTTPS